MELAGDFILVLPDEPEEKTTSGLFLPDSAKKRDNRGTVIKVGPGFPGDQMLIKEGEYILFNPHAGDELEYDGKKHLLMRQADKRAKLR